MVLDPISNIYQVRFIRLIESGHAVTDATYKLLNRYLDGKPIKAGKRNLNAADRDLDFWMASFWNDTAVEVYESETFALALARYLQQNKVTRPDWLQYLVTHVPSAVRRAIRYSQVFLFPAKSRWKEITELNFEEKKQFCEFIDACSILQKEHQELQQAIQSVEAELKRLTPLEILVYASLFAFKHLIYDMGRRELRPHQFQHHEAEENRTDYQAIANAVNQILISKLKSSGHSDFFISEKIIGKSLRKHMAPILFPSPSTARAAEKCLSILDTFERLVATYIDFNEFISGTINYFCFDDDYDIRFEEERLIVFPNIIPDESEWDRNGRKLDRLHQYWFFRAIDEFFDEAFKFALLGHPENIETNFFAWMSAFRTKLELTEIYGLEEEINTDSDIKIDLLRTLVTIELMHTFYKQSFVLPYCQHFERTGNWLTALTALSFMGLVEGENRFPITFAERKAKIDRICGWTCSEEWPKGNKKMTEAILDFWSNDLKNLSMQLRDHEYAARPELHERPIIKIGNYLFELPWAFAFQNNVTAAINNLRRLGRNRSELNSETNRIEKRLAAIFERFGFKVVGNYHPPKDADDEIGEIDLICYLEGYLFIFEIKSSYLRNTQRDAWQHRTNTIRKAALQLKRKSTLVTERLSTDPTLSSLIGDRDTNKIQTHSWIIDTSIEHDHEYFEGFLKVSLQEIIIALRNERHLLRDMNQAIADETQRRKAGRVDASDFKQICGEVMTAASKQSPADNLYPNGFSADQFATVIETGLVWEVLH